MITSERQERVSDEAAGWWLILDSGASRRQREEYVDWLRESPNHVAEMLRVAQVHGALEQFQGWSGISTAHSVPNLDNVIDFSANTRQEALLPPSTGRHSRVGLAAWAIALIATAAVAAVVVHSIRNEGMISTDRGERREVALADGSVVQIDPETRLRVIFGDRERRVMLEAGRALFHVAKSSERPFFVQANETTVRAVGTAFAVDKSANEPLLVTVSEGTVAVFSSVGHTDTARSSRASSGLGSETRNYRSSEEPAASGKLMKQIHDAKTGAGPPRGLDSVLVTAGQQVAVNDSGSEMVRSIDTTRALAWADGRLIFDNSTVADAVLQFNRYNRIQIIVNDESLVRKVINGTFNAADPESFAAFLQSVAHVRVSRNSRDDIAVDSVH